MEPTHIKTIDGSCLQSGVLPQQARSFKRLARIPPEAVLPAHQSIAKKQ